MPLHRGTLALILQAGIPAITTFLSVLVLTGSLWTPVACGKKEPGETMKACEHTLKR